MKEEEVEGQRSTLRLPGGRTIPAILVPIALSLAFVAWKTYEHRWPEPPPSDSAWKGKGDAESLDKKSEEDKMSYQDILAMVFFFVTIVSTMACVVLPWKPRWLFMSVLGCHLFTAGVFYLLHSEPKPGDIRPLVAIVSAASLMLLLAVLLPWPQWPISWTILGGAVALLSWPPFQDNTSDLGGILSFQSTFLLMLLVQKHVPQRMLPDEKREELITSRWVLNLIFSPLWLHIIWGAMCVWLGLQKDTLPGRMALGVPRKILFDLCVVLLVAVYGVVMVSAYHGGTWLTSFAASCVPFSNRTMRGLLRPPPSFSDSANAAGTVFMGLLCYYLATFLSRGSPTTRRVLSIWINATGWPIVTVLSLGLLMMPVDMLWGIRESQNEKQPLL